MADKKQSSNNLVIENTRQKITFSILEAYKTIRTNIITLLEKKNAKFFAISSSNAMEGKSTTALNIAITFSQLEKKVLIIDTDIRRPSLQKKLKMDNHSGLLDYVLNELPLKDVIQSHSEFLDVITCRPLPSKSNEVISSQKFDELLEEVRDKYDYIILDTPPIHPVSDTLVIAQRVDALFMVVRASVTKYDAFKKAVNALKVLGIEVDGVIINGADPRPKSYYKSIYSYYKSNNSYY